MRTGLTKQEKTTDIWFDEKDPLIHILLFPSDRPIQRGTTGSNAAICQRKQHYKLVEIMWICSYSCAILFSKAQNGRYKFVGEKI